MMKSATVVYRFFLLLTAILLAASSVLAESHQSKSPAVFSSRIISDQLNRPWGLAQLPSGDFLVTEKSGTLRQLSLQGDLSCLLYTSPSPRDRG